MSSPTSYEDWATRLRQHSLQRRSAARPTDASDCSSWLTALAWGTGDEGSKSHQHRLDRHYLDAQALSCPAGRPAPTTPPAGRGCSSDGPTSRQQWQTATALDAAGRDYTYANGDKARPFLTLTGQARGGMQQGTRRRLNPRFVGWLMGFDVDWCAELPRVDAMRCYGNAVVPAQAAYALLVLRQEWEAA